MPYVLCLMSYIRYTGRMVEHLFDRSDGRTVGRSDGQVVLDGRAGRTRKRLYVKIYTHSQLYLFYQLYLYAILPILLFLPIRPYAVSTRPASSTYFIISTYTPIRPYAVSTHTPIRPYAVSTHTPFLPIRPSCLPCRPSERSPRII